MKMDHIRKSKLHVSDLYSNCFNYNISLKKTISAELPRLTYRTPEFVRAQFNNYCTRRRLAGSHIAQKLVQFHICQRHGQSFHVLILQAFGVCMTLRAN